MLLLVVHPGPPTMRKIIGYFFLLTMTFAATRAGRIRLDVGNGQVSERQWLGRRTYTQGDHAVELGQSRSIFGVTSVLHITGIDRPTRPHNIIVSSYRPIDREALVDAVLATLPEPVRDDSQPDAVDG